MLSSKPRIILFHGASSAGKSTLSKAIQRALDEPFLHLASDYVSLGLPERRSCDPSTSFSWACMARSTRLPAANASAATDKSEKVGRI
jgi:chloramphenicol 3-O-phosphotransferase